MRKMYKDAQKVKFKLKDLKKELTDHSSLSLLLPYQEEEISLEQLLRNFALIIGRQAKTVYNNLINKLPDHHGGMALIPVDAEMFEKEIKSNFEVLTKIINIIRSTLYSNPYDIMKKANPKICTEIIDKYINYSYGLVTFDDWCKKNKELFLN